MTSFIDWLAAGSIIVFWMFWMFLATVAFIFLARIVGGK